MKKIIIAPDSYKGSLSALEVAKGLEQGIKRVISQVEIIKAPLADGGEGTVDALLSNLRGIYQEVQVLDPLGREIRASYGIINGDTAIIEMAAASGLPLLKREELNPLKASTYGTGQLIRDALDRGIRRIYLGLGGSATNDGGAGMVQALGFSFRDKEGKEIGPGGGELGRIEEIDASGKYGLLQEAEIIILSDVTNPLCGINGASYIFAGQKGASQEEIKILDNNLRHMGEKIKEYLDIDVIEIPGSGAAGGLGAGLLAFCQGKLYSGIGRILDLINFDDKLVGADLVITGEGKMDGQSAFGKVPLGLAKRAKKHKLPVIAVVGSLGDDYQKLYDYGIDMILDIIDRPMDLDYAMENAYDLVVRAGENLGRILLMEKYLKE